MKKGSLDRPATGMRGFPATSAVNIRHRGQSGGAERIRTIGSAYSARKTANFFDFLFSARQTDSGQQASTVSPWPGIPPCFTAFLSAAGIARAVSMSGLNSNCSLEHNLRDHKTPGVLQRRARLRTCAREHQWARYRQPHRPFHTEVKHAGNTTVGPSQNSRLFCAFAVFSRYTLATTYIAAAVPDARTKPQISGSDLPAASFRESSIRREVRSVVIVVAGVSFVPRRCVHGYVLVLLRRG